jgi:hypothetical protein
MVHPSNRLVDDGFIVLGNGIHRPVGVIPPEVTEAVRYSGRRLMRGLAMRPFTGLLVAGNKDPGQPFLYSTDFGANWQVGVANPNEGYPAYVFWVPVWNKFIAIMEEGSRSCVSISANGINWTQYPARGNVMRKATGFAVNLTGNRGIISVEGDDYNMYAADAGGVNWSAFLTGMPGGSSVVWDGINGRFLAFIGGSNNCFRSSNGLSWITAPNGPDVVQGTWAAYSVRFGGRIILFGSTENVLFTDNGGASWEAGSGLSENTSPDNRIVAINGDTLYVAYKSDYNAGSISYDAGETWTDCAHQSGKPLGIAVLLQ